jgi:hypothetical protein
MTVTITDLDWQDQAACSDHPTYPPDTWFPDGNSDIRWRLAARVCDTECPVKDACLSWTLRREAGRDSSGRSGIAGGLGPRGRWQLEQCELGRCVHLEHQGGGL